MSWLKASSIVWLFVDPPAEKLGFLLWKLLSRAASLAASDSLTKAVIWRLLAADTYMPWNLEAKYGLEAKYELEAKYGPKYEEPRSQIYGLLPLTFERRQVRKKTGFRPDDHRPFDRR